MSNRKRKINDEVKVNAMDEGRVASRNRFIYDQQERFCFNCSINDTSTHRTSHRKRSAKCIAINRIGRALLSARLSGVSYILCTVSVESSKQEKKTNRTPKK